MTSKSKPNLKASLASPSTKTPTLKDTLTLPDCANELSKLTSQTYTADAVLDLVLDGKLTPYLDFVQPLLAIQFSVENIDQSDGLLGGIPISLFQQLVVPEPADPQHLKSIKNITGLYQLTSLGAAEFGERAEGGGTHWIKMLQARIRGADPITPKPVSPPVLLHKSTGTYYAPAMAEHIEGMDDFYVLDSEIPASATLRFLSSEIEKLIRSKAPGTKWTKEAVLRHLIEHKYNQTAAGKAMGVSRQRVAELMRLHDIRNPNSKPKKAKPASFFPT